MFLIRILVAVLALIPLEGLAEQPALAAEIAVSQAQIDRLEIKLEEVRPATDEAIALLPGHHHPSDEQPDCSAGTLLRAPSCRSRCYPAKPSSRVAS